MVSSLVGKLFGERSRESLKVYAGCCLDKKLALRETRAGRKDNASGRNREEFNSCRVPTSAIRLVESTATVKTRSETRTSGKDGHRGVRACMPARTHACTHARRQQAPTTQLTRTDTRARASTEIWLKRGDFPPRDRRNRSFFVTKISRYKTTNVHVNVKKLRC